MMKLKIYAQQCDFAMSYISFTMNRLNQYWHLTFILKFILHRITLFYKKHSIGIGISLAQDIDIIYFVVVMLTLTNAWLSDFDCYLHSELKKSTVRGKRETETGKERDFASHKFSHNAHTLDTFSPYLLIFSAFCAEKSETLLMCVFITAQCVGGHAITTSEWCMYWS